MIKHSVMWKIKEMEEKSKAQIIAMMKAQLEALVGEIEGMTSLEVGSNFNASDAAYDVVLTSVHTDKEALAFYQGHEKHQKVADTYVRPYTIARVVVDYEI